MPLYGPLNAVVPPETAAEWLTQLMPTAPATTARRQLAVMQIARRTDDRYRDLPEKLARRRARLAAIATTPRRISSNWSATAARLDNDEQGLVFGESLPKGLRLA